MFQAVKAILVALAVVCALAGDAIAQNRNRGKIGSTPELEFTTSDRQAFGLKDLKGKIVLVYFWALGKDYDEEAKQLIRLHEELGPKGLELIGLVIPAQGLIKKDSVPPNVDWPHVAVSAPPGAVMWGGPEVEFNDGQVRERPWAAIVSPGGTLVWAGKFADVEQAVEAASKQYPPKLLDKDILDKAHGALKAAEVSLKVGKTLDAIQAIASLPDEARGEYRIRIAAKRLSKQVDEAAVEFMKGIDAQIEAKEFAPAWTQLMTVLKAIPDSELGKQAKSRLDTLMNRSDAKAAIERQKRNDTAAAELDAAQRLQSDRKDQAAYAKFKYVARTYADTPSAAAAAAAVATYDKEHAVAKPSPATPAASADKARSMLSMAGSYAQSGRTDMAKKKYQDVIDQFPATGFADTAKAELGKLK